MRTIRVITDREWDSVVQKTYGRPYCLQQQDGCQPRGTVRLTVPEEADDYDRTSIPEEVNHEIKGVSFSSWLGRDPRQKLASRKKQEGYMLELWWHRNFYPDLQMVANDLFSRGLLKAGNHTILIDW